MTDEDILSLLRQRDGSAVEELRSKYGAYCLRIAARILPSREDCEECFSEALLRVWNAVPPEEPENLKIYLAAVTRNLALSAYRKMSAQKRGGAEITLALEELSGCVQSAETPEDTAIAKELGSAVSRFLDTLPRRDRGVFLRRYFFTESTAEIAERFGLRESNVLMILSRTRKKLRNHLKKEGYLS